MAYSTQDPIASTFIHIPKCAGISYWKWIREVTDNVSMVGTRHTTLQWLSENHSDIGHTIAFIRNPFDRLISFYEFIGQRAIDVKNNKKSTYKLVGNKDFTCQEQIKYYEKGFDNWVDDIANGKKTPFDDSDNGSRISPYSYWLDATNSKTGKKDTVQTIIKIEELKDNINIIQDIFNTNKVLPISNTTNHTSYKDYYNNKATKKIVETWFEEDLNRFNYKF
tara:strand:- start:373 stop:1038 length:666 start_codon:yes stop_codon:yes gene_type:complete